MLKALKNLVFLWNATNSVSLNNETYGNGIDNYAHDFNLNNVNIKIRIIDKTDFLALLEKNPCQLLKLTGSFRMLKLLS